MKSGTQVAVAIGTGYLLGRTHKTRLAMMLGAGAMVGGMDGIAGQLVKRGTKVLGSADLLGKVSPQLGEIGGLLRNDLLDAGKSAAKTAVNSRMDTFSDSIRDRADAWRNPADAVSGAVSGRSRSAQNGDSDEPEGTEDEEEAPRRSATKARRSSRRPSASSSQDQDDEEARPARRTRSARSASSAAPVRRTRR